VQSWSKVDRGEFSMRLIWLRDSGYILFIEEISWIHITWFSLIVEYKMSNNNPSIYLCIQDETTWCENNFEMSHSWTISKMIFPFSKFCSKYVQYICNCMLNVWVIIANNLLCVCVCVCVLLCIWVQYNRQVETTTP